MRSIGDPNYVYKPHTPEHRQRQRDAALRRFGIPAGHHRLFGVMVPDLIYARIKAAVIAFRRAGHDVETTKAYAGTLCHSPELLDI